MLTLLGDVGGTNARFALCQQGQRPQEVWRRSCADFAGLAEVVADVLAETGAQPRLAAFAVAGPVGGDEVALTNLPWRFRISELQQRFGLAGCRIVNDFAANALALPELRQDELEPIGGGSAVAGAAKVALGPGTGLGVAGLISHGRDWLAVPGEGGHAGIAAGNDFEAAIVGELRRHRGHVSYEDLLSGPGLLQLYDTVLDVIGVSSAMWTRQQAHQPADISRIAREEPGGPAGQTVAVFSRLLGSFAGDLALIFGARGGVYLTGGVLPALGDLFDRDGFRQRFEAKGRFKDYLAAIPTSRVTAPEPALLGLSRLFTGDD